MFTTNEQRAAETEIYQKAIIAALAEASDQGLTLREIRRLHPGYGRAIPTWVGDEQDGGSGWTDSGHRERGDDYPNVTIGLLQSLGWVIDHDRDSGYGEDARWILIGRSWLPTIVTDDTTSGTPAQRMLRWLWTGGRCGVRRFSIAAFDDDDLYTHDVFDPVLTQLRDEGWDIRTVPWSGDDAVYRLVQTTDYPLQAPQDAVAIASVGDGTGDYWPARWPDPIPNPHDLLDREATAALLGVSPTMVSRYASRYPDFPQRVDTVGQTPMRRRDDIRRWAALSPHRPGSGAAN